MEETRALLQRLVDERNTVWDGSKKILADSHAEGRDMTAEERQEWERRNADVTDLDGRISELKVVIKRENDYAEARGDLDGLILPASDPTRGSSTEARVLSWARGEGPKAIDVSMAGLSTRRLPSGVVEVRDLTVGTAAAGGDLFGTQFRAVLYEHLINNSAIRKTRATVITTDSGEPLLMPKTLTHTAAGTIVAEAAAINENDPTFGQGTLNAYKYAKLVQVSRELIEDSAVDLIGYLAMSFGRALGNGSGADFVTGSGSNKPHGVIDAMGTIAQVTGGTGQSGIPTYSELVDTFHSIIPAYRTQAEWFFSDLTLSKLREIVDNYGRPLWQPGLASDVPNQLLGRPYVVDPNVPDAGTASTSIAVGDFSTYFIRDVGGFRFERSDDYAFNQDLVTYRVALRTDGDLLDLTGSIGNYLGGTA